MLCIKVTIAHLGHRAFIHIILINFGTSSVLYWWYEKHNQVNCQSLQIDVIQACVTIIRGMVFWG